MKASLVYAILIIVVVVVISLFARSNNPVIEHLDKSVEAQSNESIEQETPPSKLEAETDTSSESGVDAVESASGNSGDKQ